MNKRLIYYINLSVVDEDYRLKSCIVWVDCIYTAEGETEYISPTILNLQIFILTSGGFELVLVIYRDNTACTVSGALDHSAKLKFQLLVAYCYLFLVSRI